MRIHQKSGFKVFSDKGKSLQSTEKSEGTGLLRALARVALKGHVGDWHSCQLCSRDCDFI